MSVLATFNDSLREQVLERDGRACQFCGAEENLHVCHIRHRGMGSDDTANTPENLITLCSKHHDALDHRGGSWLQIVRWEPADASGGLEIGTYTEGQDGVLMEDAGRSLDGRKLWFYVKPTVAKGGDYARLREEIRELWDASKEALWQIVAKLALIERDKLYRAAGYTSLWHAVRDDFGFLGGTSWKLSQSSLTKYLRAYELVEGLDEKDVAAIAAETPELKDHGLLSFGAEKLYQAQLAPPEKRLDVVKAIAKGAPEHEVIEMVRKMRNPNGKPAPSCFHCQHNVLVKGAIKSAGLTHQGGALSYKNLILGDRGLSICSRYGFVISSMLPHEAEWRAGGHEEIEKCEDYRQIGGNGA